jgi:hypothetical protein
MSFSFSMSYWVIGGGLTGFSCRMRVVVQEGIHYNEGIHKINHLKMDEIWE